MDPAQAKQQIAERVKQANKFLVTVNSNPTVDQLAACIGLTLLLNKMGKHATAVFSGQVPNVLQFLEPDKTIQKNADVLRDFIISLDKDKADKLRYKVEDNVVKIFITPYRTSLSQKDLVFSEGDFNVEAVIALGVTQRNQLDQAITAHGRILHDATVISINAGVAKAADLGQINWADQSSSSLSEMLVSISEALGTGLIDTQIATAFLTGIVAETDRFSNKKTSPKVMTMSAQLMAAGANQQLIVNKLEPVAPPPPPPPPPKPAPPPPAPPKPKQPPKEPPKPPTPPPKPVEPPKPPKPPLKPEGVIDVPHSENGESSENVDLGTTEIHIDEQGNLITSQDLAKKASEEPAAPVAPAPPPAVAAAPAPLIDEQKLEPMSMPPPPPPPTAAPAPPPPPVAPPPPPEIVPAPAPPSPPPPPGHSFMGSSAQPDWATPYDLVPMDPMRQAGTPPQGMYSAPVGDIAHAHDIQPPPEMQAELDHARDAVQSALAGAPFDAATAGPVQALNAAPVSPEPIHVESTVTPAPVAAPSQATDTPMLVLPTDNGSSLTATEPVAVQPSAPPAPPPVPPPLPPIQ